MGKGGVSARYNDFCRMTKDTGVSDETYNQIVASIKTQKRINLSGVQWDFWVSHSDAAQVMKQLQADGVIGPPYIDDDLDLIFHDVVGTADAINVSSKTQLWRYQIQTAFDFIRYLWLKLKNKRLGRKHLLDIVPDAFTHEAAKWGIEYRLSDNQGLADGTRCIAAEMRPPVESAAITGFSQGVEAELTQLSPNFQVKSIKNRVEVSFKPNKQGKKAAWIRV